jgi:oxygen-independent coproporphyrinogen III oxidase
MPQSKSATMLSKYSEERLPRYTSYPTAPNFSAEFSTDTYRDWLGNIPADKPISLYLHVPFCRSMCWYCGCHTKVSQQDAPIIDYLATLQQEIELTSDAIGRALPAGHIHFGGGTPTIMGPDAFQQVMAQLNQKFQISETTEIAIEVDPRTMTSDMAKALGQGGVNRASLGVQSFDPLVQKAINRVQSFEQTNTAVIDLRNVGVKGISFDLIYGLPHQTVESCIQTVEQALEMRPDRFSVFGYAHIPSFKKHQEVIDELPLPDGQERHEQAEAISDTLVAAGYQRIGLDHYALPGDDLAIAQAKGDLHRNFQGYTTDVCDTLVGFGASSIGRFSGGYVQNNVALGQYAKAISRGELATAKGYQFIPDDLLRADIIERLMCDFEATIEQICATHNVDSASLLDGNDRLKMLAEDGLVTISNGRIIVNKDMRFIVRQVAASFDSYIGLAGRTHSRAA